MAWSPYSFERSYQCATFFPIERLAVSPKKTEEQKHLDRKKLEAEREQVIPPSIQSITITETLSGHHLARSPEPNSTTNLLRALDVEPDK
jgi:hypothetical protein